MSRIQLCLVCACVIAMNVGCQSRCNNTCGGGWLAGNSTLAPPPTYSLNIPSVANNQPYYTPGQTPPNNYTLNPNQSAPTAAQGQNGWRAANTGASNENESRSVLTTQTKFVETQPTNNPMMNPGNQPVRTAALPGSGVSFTNSQNYQSTQFDERQDASRLAVTDASAVRAPARNYPTGNLPQYQQQTYVAQNGYYQQPNYAGSMVMYNGQPNGYQGQTVLVNPYANSGYTGQAVMAQSTVSPSSAGASQVGWQSRELNSDRISR